MLMKKYNSAKEQSPVLRVNKTIIVKKKIYIERLLDSRPIPYIGEKPPILNTCFGNPLTSYFVYDIPYAIDGDKMTNKMFSKGTCGNGDLIYRESLVKIKLTKDYKKFHGNSFSNGHKLFFLKMSQ